jgi:hypothetical protein
VLKCTNGVGSNHAEGKTNNLSVKTLSGWMFIRSYKKYLIQPGILRDPVG